MLIRLLQLAGGIFALWVVFTLFFKPQRRPSPLPKQPRGPRLTKDRYDLKCLAAHLDWDEDALRKVRPSYGSLLVEKRGPYRGGGRQRKLHVPDETTKDLQRRILRRVLARLRVHPCSQGFEKGNSVPKNASVHAHQAVVMKLDIESFFENTKEERVRAYFRFIGWDGEATEVLTRLTTWEGSLPQGAPTSPALSNRLNMALDHAIHQEAQRRRGTYTRYADDITVSFPRDYPRKMRGMEQAVRRIATRTGYKIHKKRKRRIMRRHQRQEVTGLVVNDGARVPRKTRRWLRAVEHRLKTQGAATLTPEQLAGWKAYVSHVDEERVRSEKKLELSVEFAWQESRHSMRDAADRLGTSLPRYKTYMKLFGLWDESKAP